MKLHEYQAKALLAKFGVPVPKGTPIFSVSELPKVKEKLPRGPWVVKAQVHAGGRGKAGGVRVVHSDPELEQAIREILGMKLVTPQTSSQGVIVRKVHVEEACTLDRELYLACTLSRSKAKPVLIASARGGVEIEELARTRPETIFQEEIDPLAKLAPGQAERLEARLGLSAASGGVSLIQGVVEAFFALDCSLVEINPLGVTRDGKVVALDAKMVLDDNGLFRHPELKELRDTSEENTLDIQAFEAGVNYIALDGAIGCLVNGAGLAMATMDLIKIHGGEPANFLDVGGGANLDQVTQAFRILLSEPKVKAVLVNIFGGIMRCDVIAEALVASFRQLRPRVPFVVRLEGTQVEEGRGILTRSSLPLTPAKDLTDAAEKVVAAANHVYPHQ